MHLHNASSNKQCLQTQLLHNALYLLDLDLFPTIRYCFYTSEFTFQIHG